VVNTLLIGLDGATFTVLDSLTDVNSPDGVVMPCLKRLMERGFRAKLRSTAHPLTPPAWVSLMTGRTPGHHGVYDFVRFEDRGDEVFFTLYDARDIKEETIWSMASRQERSIASLNFPMMAPPLPVNGNLIPGFVSWKHLRRNMTPDSLYDRVRQIAGFNPKDLAWDFERESKIGEEMTPDELESWIRHHLPREQQWFRIAETLIQEDQPDLFAIMFDGTDKIQHQAWHVLDPALAPEKPDERHVSLRGLVLSYFRQLDQYIERLVSMAGPTAQVFFASDHGFTGSTEVVRINRFLGDLGYLAWKAAGQTEAERRRENSNFAYVDWAKTTAFCPTPSSNGICIRLADKAGPPGVRSSDYVAFRAKLIEDLRGLRCPETNEPIIRDVLLREEVFPGAATGDAPDITLVLRDYGFVSVRNRAPIVQPRPTVLGTHHPDGIFIASGPGIQNTRIDLMSIIDVAPILLHSLGLPVPVNLEGTIPDDLLSGDYLMRNPIREGPPTAGARAVGEALKESSDNEMSEQDREKILDQLRLLGYLED
jgi:predicted AlkP superfamily phosphohydrolase/phosphomutase